MLKLTRGKPKFAQITGGEIFREGPKPKNLQITRMKFKKNILQRKNRKCPILQWGKALLTLFYFYLI